MLLKCYISTLHKHIRVLGSLVIQAELLSKFAFAGNLLEPVIREHIKELKKVGIEVLLRPATPRENTLAFFGCM